MSREPNPADFRVLKEAGTQYLLKALDGLGDDFSGLTTARLRNIREGMKFIGKSLETAPAVYFDPQFSGGVFVAAYVLEKNARRYDPFTGWNKTQEIRSGSQHRPDFPKKTKKTFSARRGLL